MTVFSIFHTNFSNKITPSVPALNTAGSSLYAHKKNKIKISPLLGSIAGMGISSVYIISRAKNTPNLLKKIWKTDFTSSKNIIITAAGSILGGFIGGMIDDKKKKKWEKIKEANFQLLSNIIFPLIFRDIFGHISLKFNKNASKRVKNISNFVSVFSGVIVGAAVGSTVANKVNGAINPEKKYERKLGVKDFLVHIDDLPMVFALSGVPYIDKLIPFILVSRGYDVGKQG